MRLFLALIISAFTFQLRAQESFDTYTNETKKYTIDYPCDWIKKESSDGFDLFLIAPEHAANVSIISGELPKGVTLDTYTKENIKNLFSGNSTIKIVDSGMKEINSVPAFWIKYTRDDQKTTIVHYFMIVGSRAYLLTMGAPTDSFDNYQTSFERILNSFCIIQN